MQTLSSEQEAINNRLTPTADRFSERSWVSGIQYATYQPQAISGGEKNPLIIWLHGIGEVGTDLNFPLLSSEVRSEKATLFCTIFIKCFLLSGHSLSDGCLIIETTVNAMMIPPVDIVLGFKG